MSDGADLSFDFGHLDRESERLVRGYLTAGTRAVAGATKRLERNLEAATLSAAGGNLWRAWQSSTYPRSGPARDPTGIIWLKGGERTRGAITFWTQPGAVRGKGGQYLAIPLPSAGSRGRARNLTPGDWERAHPGVRLQFVYRQGKPSLLVAVGGTTNARTGAFRGLTAGRSSKGRGGANPLATAAVPIFVLIPVVQFRNAFAIEPMVRQAEQELVTDFLRAVGAVA